jgi:hypothetical protein
MIPKHQQINVWMNMSETPEKKKARLRYDWQIYICKMLISIFSWFFQRFDWTDFIQNATECTILRPSEKKFIFSWLYHTIFKVLTTQILYPKCNRMHHFASFWNKNFRPPPTLPILVSRELACNSQMNWNLVGSIYGRSSTKIAHFVPVR